MRPIVFVSGPLTTGAGKPEDNAQRAIQLAAQLVRNGYSAICPHHSWDYQERLNVRLTHEQWMEVWLPQLQRADAMYRILGDSKGSQIEDDHAVGWGIPAFTSLWELDHWRDNQWCRPAEKPVTIREPHGDTRFLERLEKIKQTHIKNCARKGLPGHPYANIERVASRFSRPAWVQAAELADDALVRLAIASERNDATREYINNAVIDAASYAIISDIEHEAQYGNGT